MNLEQFVQLRDLENFHERRVDAAQPELGFHSHDQFVHGHQFADCRAGKVLDVLEIEQNLARAIHQAREFFAQLLDVLLVQNLSVGEVDDCDAVDVLLHDKLTQTTTC